MPDAKTGDLQPAEGDIRIAGGGQLGEGGVPGGAGGPVHLRSVPAHFRARPESAVSDSSGHRPRPLFPNDQGCLAKTQVAQVRLHP